MTTTEKVYITTKEECQKQIDSHLGFVCSSCGGNLSPLETVDNSDRPTYWAGCESCCQFDWGVSREIFLIAKEMVVHQHHVHYSHVDGRYGDTEKQEYYFKAQIGGTSKFIARIFSVQKAIRQRAMENLLNPAQGAVINTMNNIDPNEKQATEEMKAEGQEIAAVESEAQEKAMESEEGTTEG